MKVIDLLNKIANGEEVPKYIFYLDQEWKYNKYNDYEGLKYGGCLLNHLLLNELNNEVEIINGELEIQDKPKKIEKLTPFEAPYLKDDGKSDVRFQLIINQLNEVIDVLNNMEE